MKLISLFPKIFLLIILLYTFSQCASRGIITGGPKDTIPPTLVYSIPKHQTTDWKAEEFAFVFDEVIQLNNIREQLIITPRIDFEYDYKYRKKSLTLDFNGNFADSTTYTFNFRETIEDITEGNPSTFTTFTFSTTTFLDSLSIEGRTFDLLSQDTLKNVTIGMYQSNDTINTLDVQPYYFTKSDEEGFYKIENIRNGKYLIMAFQDGNSNLIPDTESEKFAFVADTVQLDSSFSDIDFYLVQQDLRELRNTNASTSGTYFHINFNKFIESFSVTNLGTEDSLNAQLTNDNRTIRIFPTLQIIDSLPVFFSVVDTVGYELEDTVYINFRESSRKAADFTLSATPSKNDGITKTQRFEFDFNKPVVRYNIDSIYFRYDSTRLDTFKIKGFKWSDHAQLLQFESEINPAVLDTLEAQKQKYISAVRDSLAQLQQADTMSDDSPNLLSKGKQTVSSSKSEKKIVTGFHLHIGSQAFISADRDTLSAIDFSYNILNTADYGTINGQVTSDHSSFQIQLLNNKNAIVAEIKNQKDYQFVKVKPGNYKIRVLIDNDNNGTWDAGDYFKRQMPEDVYYFPEELTIRANWELNKIDLSF
jgi:uncharacterized protein (DUF2141 family)